MSWRPNGLARASIRFRPSSFVGAFVALLFASATVSAAALFLQTGITAGATPDRYVTAPVVVAAGDEVREVQDDGWTASTVLGERPLVDAGLADRLAALAGVGTVVPDTSFPVSPAEDALATATGPAWTAEGWSATALWPPSDVPASDGPDSGEVALDPATAGAAGLRVGDDVALTTPSGQASFTVAALVESPSGGGPRAWFADADAATLAGHPGRVQAIAVLPAAGTSTAELAGAVRDVVDDAAAGPTGLVVTTGDERGEVESPGFAMTREMLTALGGSLGGILLVVAVFVVVSTTSLAVEQRGRELALLRAIGATPRQLRRTVGVEAGLVALLAAPLGLVPGVLLSRWLLGAMQDRGLLVPGVELSVGPLALGVSALIVAASAIVAGVLAARRPARIRPAEALREVTLAGGRLGPMRWLLGLVALAGSVPLAVVSANAPGDLGMGLATTVVLTLLIAVGLLGPVLAGLIARLVQPLLDRFGVAGRLAAANGRTNSRRLASAITPLVMAVAFAGTTLFLQGSVDRAARTQAEAALVADTVVTSAGVLPAEVTGQVADLPGVSAAIGVLPSSVVGGSVGELVPYSAYGVAGDLDGLSETLDLGVRAGDLARLRPATGGDDAGTIALDHQLAGALGATVGERVDLYAPDGTPMRPEVVAVYSRGLGTASALMPYESVRGPASGPVVQQVLVRHAGPPTDGRLAALRDVAGPGARTATPAALAAEQRAEGQADTWLNNVVAAALAGFAAIAAVNTLVMIGLARGREVALLGMIGATRRQVLRTARLEALVVSGAAVVLGSLIAWGTLQQSVRGATGAGPYVPAPVAVAILGGVVVLTLVATGLPTRALLRRSRAAAAGTRE
ncbi:FtsX-like permease family protein [Modestobacter italicus]|uniref:FtsX-like permease family protein n=1 Tax=Modestobacter italicus (strain DSM 44449 / CECT 9708 / BC 501) TaxID=2732864 RepID=UPI001C95BF43|nr:FtsX-like permease family protein [Modestobacter italicus]